MNDGPGWTSVHGVHLKADVAQAIAAGQKRIEDADLAADIVTGIWLQVARSTLERPPARDLADQVLAAVLRALVPRSQPTGSSEGAPLREAQ